MTDWVMHSVPRACAVLREQVRAMRLALRIPALALAALMGLATLMAVGEMLRGPTTVDFHPERWIFPAVAGLLLPIAVWTGEERFGAGFLWTLPVDRRHHALARVCAGWVWLMMVVAVLVLWLLALALASGGNVLGEETLQLVAPGATPRWGAVDPAQLRAVQWRPEPVLWLVPFTGATVIYLLASAVALGVRRPLWWVAGTVLALFLATAVLNEIGMAAGSRELVLTPSRLLSGFVYGRYGLETLLIANSESLSVETWLSTGEAAVVWLGLPHPGPWAAATLLWMSAGLVALWAAASRHRETRRG
ncbi:MAG TPA: hypothetical protein VLK84_15465 [Longimicrobium sp.]|nr:hypothetical protein [Longimicrobium sp.]